MSLRSLYERVYVTCAHNTSYEQYKRGEQFSVSMCT